MRNLNECQAEVFRRSEKRIKARKQRRNHILMACIPLVLCITLFSAFVLPDLAPDKSTDPGIADGSDGAIGGLSENKQESPPCPIAKITVAGSDFSQSYTDVSDVLLISAQLSSYTYLAPESNEAMDESTRGDGFKESANGSDPLGSLADLETTGYTISLVMPDGSKLVYCLTDDTLKNLTTNQTYPLSQNQVAELKELLGIPQQ